MWTDDNGMDDRCNSISQEEAIIYEVLIHEAILKDRMLDEARRGLMDYYDEKDSVNKKVHSLFVDVEVHDGQLWGVATITLLEPLAPEELAKLKDNLEGQYSDGFGESFEQHEIKTDNGDLYVSFWSHNRNFFMDTEAEFAKRLGVELPKAAKSGRVDFRDISIRKLSREEQNALKLSARLNKNLSDYHEAIQKLDKADIIGRAREIAVVKDMHQYLMERYVFEDSEVEYLLKFQNPLQVAAERWSAINDLIDMSAVIPDIIGRQGVLQGNHMDEQGFKHHISELQIPKQR